MVARDGGTITRGKPRGKHMFSILPLSLSHLLSRPVIRDYSCVIRDDRTHNNYRDVALEYVFVIRYLGSRTAPPSGGVYPGRNFVFNVVHQRWTTLSLDRFIRCWEPTRARVAITRSRDDFRLFSTSITWKDSDHDIHLALTWKTWVVFRVGLKAMGKKYKPRWNK